MTYVLFLDFEPISPFGAYYTYCINQSSLKFVQGFSATWIIFRPLDCFDAITDQQTITSWSAPIMWDGTFDPVERDEFYFKRKAVIGLTVFAIGRYLDRYLKDFLESAEQHFMKGHRVIYYVMVDVASKVPALKMPSERTMIVIQVPKQSRWQDISMMRMYQINDLIQDRVQFQVTHLFCFDVDQVFVGRFGVEALADSVAQIHAAFFTADRNKFTYERNPKSAAYIAPNEGDFYYHAAVFGGRPDLVLNLTRTCLEGIIRDKSKKIEAVWHDESHLNRYFLDHKPAKLLSPEYCWDLKPANYIRYVRLKWMPKEYKKLRDN
ncbi:N-acetyllactosaminide alpha-1,3-galactosyltransferase-like [Carcharodon carcharias]|uniref:N-acetyllactosaminide alpha-1,3-galactosyltransferase-like n=1 Tax=Carcharodon carcharias TaxID=13397 RepID=UPI001B7F6CB3|nr:N-acetyllactosaminide alpha-1,3-galactosyltransferase-like [Carcharodon carcharias]